MINYAKELEIIANGLLSQSGMKPNYSNKDFMSAIIIFQSALMDKMFDMQNFDKMSIEDREKMAFQCGTDFRKFIHTYTGLDTHNISEFTD